MSEVQVTGLQAYVRSDAVQGRLEELVGERKGQLTTTIMSVINSNLMLQQCERSSVMTAVITAVALNLPINPNLGFAYIIPYKHYDKQTRETTWLAQFQLGYKGFVQLAMRSNQYKTINVVEVREGEIKGVDRMSGEIDFDWFQDETEREKLPVIGYVAYFKNLNGFEKNLYMTVDKVTKHAKKYSQSFKKGYGLWVDDFDKMAKKTVLKLLISGYGAMSTDIIQALQADQAAVGSEDTFDYIDNKPEDDVDQTPNTDTVEDTAEKEQDNKNVTVSRVRPVKKD